MTYNCYDNLILPLQGMSMESVQRNQLIYNQICSVNQLVVSYIRVPLFLLNGYLTRSLMILVINIIIDLL